MAHGEERPSPLPDLAERQAAEMLELALAGHADEAAILSLQLQQHDEELRARGEAPTGLADNSEELLAALGGEDAYTDFAERALDDGEIDTLMRRRLEVHLESQPLARAKKRRGEHLRAEIAAVFNRISAPLSQLALGNPLGPIETGRAALAALLVTNSRPEMTTQERQALRAYEEFLERHPHAPEAEEVAEEVAEYREELHAELHDEAMELAKRSLEAGRPDAALAHLDRAERLEPLDEDERELREEALEELDQRDDEIQSTLEVRPLEDGAEGYREAALAEVLLGAPLAEVAARARALDVDDEDEPNTLDDELSFVEAWDALARGDEDGYYEALEDIAEQDLRSQNMARHARWLLADPNQNPYGFYRAAQRAERSARLRWLAFGRYARGPARRDLPRPLEWLLGVPGMAVAVVTIPLRMLQYPSSRARFGGHVIRAGERYVARFPDGAHAEEVHRELEWRYAGRSQWTGAYTHHSALAEPHEETIARYREEIAERALRSAERQHRLDMRMSVYRSIVEEYPDTPQADEARREFERLVANGTPQEIRVSREFLEEHPILWQPPALGLREELFDGDEDNGELARAGVVLVGQTVVRVALVDHEPVMQRVPPENFAHFVALLEEASYHRLASDERERPQPDPERDLFFERARLGLLDRPDMRPAAGSHATFLGSQETHGLVRRRSSLLPVELVLQGGLENFGLSVFPRVTPPGKTPDAFLYR